MNEIELQQKIAEYFAKLSPEMQKVFESMEWLKTLQSISEKYSLNKEQIETLGTETTLVLLGIIQTEEYEENIRKEINLPLEKMEDMILEINSIILSPIREGLSNAFEKNINDLVKEEENKNTNKIKINIAEDFNKVQKVETNYSLVDKTKQNSIKDITKEDTTTPKTIDPYRMPIE